MGLSYWEFIAIFHIRSSKKPKKRPRKKKKKEKICKRNLLKPSKRRPSYLKIFKGYLIMFQKSLSWIFYVYFRSTQYYGLKANINDYLGKMRIKSLKMYFALQESERLVNAEDKLMKLQVDRDKFESQLTVRFSNLSGYFRTVPKPWSFPFAIGYEYCNSMHEIRSMFEFAKENNNKQPYYIYWKWDSIKPLQLSSKTITGATSSTTIVINNKDNAVLRKVLRHLLLFTLYE